MKRSLKKELPILFLICLILCSGCSGSTMASWAYPFVKWDDVNYKITSEEVPRTDIEQRIGKIKRFSDRESSSVSNGFSNAYPKGTKLYAIKGISQKDGIALEVEDGRYLKAVGTGEKQLLDADGVGTVFSIKAGKVLILDSVEVDDLGKSWQELADNYQGQAIWLSTRAKLKVGERVAYWTDGGIDTSFPAQAKAKKIYGGTKLRLTKLENSY
ncbi:hypothetical protein BVG16_26970 [Paenibacillus selenitireducens]|uniref:Uncharacterized protein n=1 Tax=Paenibacillus selenitireducens TaxID=1324314 RepID=A0A1T2X1N7_9BACL|nr:DUF3221 domain-containing protein [Paenibacillus selenitireducens]OPA73735.1 hypothetical protein BVG16_26970 [Paenibacillus selenitireducens]